MSKQRTATTIVPYFGAKGRLGSKIAELLGQHTTYFEPFCGSLGVFLAKPPCRIEVLNDAYADLINLIRIIAHPTLHLRLYRMLRRLPSSEDLHREYRQLLTQPFDLSSPNLERAVAFFYVSLTSLAGTVGVRTKPAFAARYDMTGGTSVSRRRCAVNSIPFFFRRLRDAIIMNRDAFTLIDRIPDTPATAIYCDPPYLSKKGSYIHDFTDDDHARLSDSLSRFKHARIVVSYYDDPRLHDLYPNWTFVPAPIRAGLSSRMAPEMLICNFEPPSHSSDDSPLFTPGETQ